MKKREGEVDSSKDTAAVIEDRMMKLQQENEALMNEVMGLQKEIYKSIEMMEAIKEKVQEKEKEWTVEKDEYEKKIDELNKALKVKSNQLIKYLQWTNRRLNS